MIRAYQKDDNQALVNIWYDASILAHAFIPREFWAAEKINIQEKYLPLSETYVKEVDGQVVGFISLIDDFIGGLFVAPAYQGQGVGTELMNKARSLRKELAVEVYQANPQAQRFYEKCGFQAVEERVQPETGCVSIVMQLGD